MENKYHPLTEEEFNEIFKAYDKDGNGVVTKDML
jgi:Ca2+-binding EF-hand superfamily protein